MQNGAQAVEGNFGDTRRFTQADLADHGVPVIRVQQHGEDGIERYQPVERFGVVGDCVDQQGVGGKGVWRQAHRQLPVNSTAS